MVKERLTQWLYYFIIGGISLVTLVFLPMVGSEVGMEWNLPTTPIGWGIWIITKLIVSILNILLFHCFMEQAKINVKDNERYKEAYAKLYEIAPKVYNPRSPKQWNKREYTTKGITLFVFTALSTVALTQAVLTFDYMSLLTYLFTIIIGIVFGIIQMKKAELYWTTEFCDFANNFYEQHKEDKDNGSNNREQNLQEHSGTNSEE